ncbi:hypothetical protein PoB_004960900 [Plakobranchus ocellatus]|uniref:Uncharacterized protein n=1 Tax=Plakobranchus ocellatus TaxID=259542 RepID=A0AAV4BSG7_9GAST|nr:hypothetical protein PoB_004960900 [Plakobranchus ocellatus]
MFDCQTPPLCSADPLINTRLLSVLRGSSYQHSVTISAPKILLSTLGYYQCSADPLIHTRLPSVLRGSSYQHLVAITGNMAAPRL